jgi:hypothetical protein
MISIISRHGQDAVFAQDDAEFIEIIFLQLSVIFREIEHDKNIVFIDVDLFLVGQFKKIFLDQFMEVIFFHNLRDLSLLWTGEMYPIYIAKMQNGFHG